MCIRHHVRVQNEFIVDASTTRTVFEETLTKFGANEQKGEFLFRSPTIGSSCDCKGRAGLDEAEAIREMHPHYWSEGQQHAAFRSKRPHSARASTSRIVRLGTADERVLEGAVHKLLPTPPDSEAQRVRHYRDGGGYRGVSSVFREYRRPQSARQFSRTTDANPSLVGGGLFSLTSVALPPTMGALREDGMSGGDDEAKKVLGCKRPPYAISSWGGGADGYLGQYDRRIMRVPDFSKMIPRVSSGGDVCLDSGPSVEAQRSSRQKEAAETRPRVSAADLRKGLGSFSLTRADAAEPKPLCHTKDRIEGTASMSAAGKGGATPSASNVPVADPTSADDADATKGVCPSRAPERARIIYDYASFMQGTGHRVESAGPERHTANGALQMYPRACSHVPSVKLGSYSSRADAQFATGRFMAHTKGNIASGAPPPLPPSVEAARALVKDAIAKGTFAGSNQAKRSYRFFGKNKSDTNSPTMSPNTSADISRGNNPLLRASSRTLPSDHRRTDDEETIAQALIDEAELRYVLSDAGATRVRARAALRAHYRHRPYSEGAQLYNRDRDVGDFKPAKEGSKATPKSSPTRHSRLTGCPAGEFTSSAATGRVMSSAAKKTAQATGETLSRGRGANRIIASREGNARAFIDRADSISDPLTRAHNKIESSRADRTNEVQKPASSATMGWRKRSVFDAYSTI